MTDKKHITFDIETTGLNAWYGDRVTCICAKDSAARHSAKPCRVR
jgi:hypothetical protein